MHLCPNVTLKQDTTLPNPIRRGCSSEFIFPYLTWWIANSKTNRLKPYTNSKLEFEKGRNKRNHKAEKRGIMKEIEEGMIEKDSPD
jgi:hypothetical protein